MEGKDSNNEVKSHLDKLPRPETITHSFQTCQKDQEHSCSLLKSYPEKIKKTKKKKSQKPNNSLLVSWKYLWPIFRGNILKGKSRNQVQKWGRDWENRWIWLSRGDFWCLMNPKSSVHSHRAHTSSLWQRTISYLSYWHSWWDILAVKCFVH